MAYNHRTVILFWVDQVHVCILLTKLRVKWGICEGLVSRLTANCLAWTRASKFAIASWSNMLEATFLRSTCVLQHQQVIKL